MSERFSRQLPSSRSKRRLHHRRAHSRSATSSHVERGPATKEKPLSFSAGRLLGILGPKSWNVGLQRLFASVRWRFSPSQAHHTACADFSTSLALAGKRHDLRRSVA